MVATPDGPRRCRGSLQTPGGPPRRRLPARLKADPDDVATLLDVALDEGLVELWPDCPTGPAVMMSSLERAATTWCSTAGMRS
ncbi:MAG: hypothetical protein WKF75_14165 [Singulisphaera sp.]